MTHLTPVFPNGLVRFALVRFADQSSPIWCTFRTLARHVAISYGWRRPLRRACWPGMATGWNRLRTRVTAGDKSEIHTRKQMQLIAVHVERVHG